MGQIKTLNKELTWEDGIIGKIESFLLSRFPIGKMWARACATAIVSSSLGKVKLEDKWGDVRPNIFIINIAKSGLGWKSPLIRFVRRVIVEFNPTVLAPPKFTPEGFTEWVIGTKKKSKKEDDDREVVHRHLVNSIVRDEADKILGETYHKYNVMKQYLSELWDGWIEGYYTRSYQYEGNVSVYVTLLGASSDLFFKMLDEDFFRQGLGNRILWIVEDNPAPEKLDSNQFFFNIGQKDEEFSTLQKETVERLQRLSDVVLAFMFPNAGKLWVEYQHECSTRAYKAEALQGSYEIKQPLNALKLAMIYAAGRMDLTENLLNVKEEDMRRAIEDMKTYTNMWERAMDWWETISAEKNPTEKRLETTKYDMRKMILFGTRQEDGIFTAQMIRGAFEWTDLTKIADVLLMAEDKGWVKMVAETSSQGSLTAEQYNRIKPRRGFTPRIWKVTKAGMEESKKFKV